MKESEFEKGIKRVENNFGNMNLGLKLELWSKFKNTDLRIWKEMIDDILHQDFKPKIADFYRVYRENKLYGNNEDMTECRQCGKDYHKPNWQNDYDDWCISCLKWRDTPEGQAELEMNRKKLLQSIDKFERGHRMVKNTGDVPF